MATEHHAGNLAQKEAQAQGKTNLRASTVEQFVRCPYQYFQFHVMGKQKRRPSAAAYLGTSVHKGMEVGLTEKIKTGALPPKSVVLDAAHEEWMNLSSDEDIEYNENSNENFSTVDEAVVTGAGIYYEELMPTIQPTATERVLVKPIDHPIFANIQGSIDIEEERGVSDLKVTKDKTQGAKHVLQLSVYGYLRQEEGTPVSYANIDNVIKGRKLGSSKMRTARLAVKANADFAKFWIDKILETTAEFHVTGNENLFRGTSPSNSFLCNPNWCTLWDECPYVAGYR